MSDTYMGRAFDDYYAFDPTDGSLQTVRIDLDPSTVNPSGNETFNQATIDKMCQALNSVLNKAVVAAHENEVGRLVHAVFDEFYTSTGKGVDEPLSDDEVGKLTTLIMSSLEPFLSQLIQRLDLPSDEYGALLPGDHWALLRSNRH